MKGISMELYPHNQMTYNKIFQTLVFHRKCALIQGTGTGKTFILMKLLETLFQGRTVWIIEPNKSIAEGIQLYDDWNYPNVRFITYDSLVKVTDYPEVLVIDELHRAGAPGWNKAVQRVASHVCYFFGMTATEYRYLDGKRNMAIELFGDDVVYGPSYDEAIQLGILTGYDYYAILSDTEEYADKLDKLNLSSEMKARVKQLRLNEYQLSQRIQSHIDDTHKKWVIFYPSIAALEEADDEVRSWFGNENLPVYKVYHKQSAKSNKEAIVEFNNNPDYCAILSVDMLTAGVHLKGVTGVIFASKTSSGNVFIQQMGRGSSTNKDVRIVYLDLVRNFDNVKEVCKRVEGARARISGKSQEKVVEQQVLICYDELLLELDDILAKAEGRWSEFDEDIVRVFYPIEGASCWLRIPHHTKQDVVKRARILGVTKTRRWTDTEDYLLRIYYQTERDSIWKRLPSRSMQAIKSRAKVLGLVTEWSKEEELLLLRYYETKHVEEIVTMLEGKTVDDVDEKARKLGLSRSGDFV